MRKVLIILGGLLAALAAAVAALVVLFPVQRVRAEALRAVEAATGRAVAIDGPVKLMLYPVLGLEAQGVRLANAPGGQAEHLLSAESAAIGVKLLPLLRGDVEVKRLELIKPTLALEVSAEGEPNWLLGPQDAPSQTGPEIKSLSLADVRVEDGLVSFVSLADMARYEVADIDLAASLANLESPLALDGAFTYRNERTTAKLAVARPRAFLEPGTTPIRLDLAGGTALGGLDGALDVATGRIVGKVDIKGENFRRLSAWLGAPLGEGPGFGPYSAQGALTIADGAVRLEQADLTLDALRASGDLILASGETRPKLSGDLRMPALDLNTYIAAAPTPEPGVNVQTGWSEAPFDFSGLKGFDADLRLQVGALVFQKMRLEAADVWLKIDDGLLDATLRSMTLYGGRGRGRLQLDASGAMPKVAHALTVEDVQALPFLSDAIGLDRLAGLARLELAVAGQGRSQAALMRDLDGSLALSMRDGEIKGLSLSEIARTVRAALSGGAMGPAAATDFGSFSASFTIRDGVAATSDVALQAPYLRISGAGVLDLGAQTADLRLDPKAVRSAQGQGGSSADAVGGIGVPFRVSGEWNNLKFTPDLAGAAQQAIQSQLQKILGAGGLSGLFGREPPEKKPADAQTPPPRQEKPLQGLFDRVLRGGGG